MIYNDQALEGCRSARQIAKQSLSKSLQTVLSKKSPPSEIMVRDAWLYELRKNSSVFPDGWYIPPPHGIGVLFGTSGRDSRMNYLSLRSEKFWPQKTIILKGKNQMGYVYASPVDAQTGTIGDFGMTFYLGNNSHIKDHLKCCLDLNRELFDYASIDMPFAHFYRYAAGLFTRYSLANNVTSSTDSAGVNIGHTVPLLDEQEKALCKKKDMHWSTVSTMISKKRLFVNGGESQRFLPGMAVTLEPRLVNPRDPTIPMSSFHTIMLFHADGSKELLTDFDDIFTLMRMDYMLQ